MKLQGLLSVLCSKIQAYKNFNQNKIDLKGQKLASYCKIISYSLIDLYSWFAAAKSDRLFLVLNCRYFILYTSEAAVCKCFVLLKIGSLKDLAKGVPL